MTFFISIPNFEELLSKWAQEKPIYVTKSIAGYSHYQKYTLGNQDPIVYDGIRAVEPIKSFFFKASECVAKYPSISPSETGEEQGNFIIVGAKSCDLKAIESMDNALAKGAIKEPFYVEARGNATIISSDCSSPSQSCFCTTLGLNPYPEEGFDINLSRIPGGLIIETGSEKGEKLISANKDLFMEASPYHIEKRDKQRRETSTKVKEQNERFEVKESFREIIMESGKSSVWSKYAGRCLECAACLSVCPTCHCFLLYDQKENGHSERVRIWDFCYYRGFARVGGGSNARPTMNDRFKNKYIKKFDFCPANFGIYACSGCGRCIDSCMANIDMRQVLKELNDES